MVCRAVLRRAAPCRTVPCARPGCAQPPPIYALNRVMTELEQQQFDSFCKQMQAPSE
uniref:Small vasohibin-binding protein n=1 Tax=Anser cygnoides TaxID=8845 RepID=A0A8B9ESD7_ANSCY